MGINYDNPFWDEQEMTAVEKKKMERKQEKWARAQAMWDYQAEKERKQAAKDAEEARREEALMRKWIEEEIIEEWKWEEEEREKWDKYEKWLNMFNIDETQMNKKSSDDYKSKWDEWLLQFVK